MGPGSVAEARPAAAAADPSWDCVVAAEFRQEAPRERRPFEWDPHCHPALDVADTDCRTVRFLSILKVNTSVRNWYQYSSNCSSHSTTLFVTNRSRHDNQDTRPFIFSTNSQIRSGQDVTVQITE